MHRGDDAIASAKEGICSRDSRTVVGELRVHMYLAGIGSGSDLHAGGVATTSEELLLMGQQPKILQLVSAVRKIKFAQEQ